MARFNRNEAIAKCRSDINYLGVMSLGSEVMKSPFPPEYVTVFHLVTENVNKPKFWMRYLVALPRGHAKTTFLKVLVLWLMLFTPLKSFLIICNTKPLSQDILADLADMLDSRDIVMLFGNWATTRSVDSKERKEFVFLGKEFKIESASSMGKVRGKTRRGRPQVYIIDDMQSREEAESPTISSALWAWFNTTLLKGRDGERCIAIYCGNKYASPDCVVTKLQKHPRWISLVVGALLSDGSAIWPSLRSKKDLLDEYQDDLWSGIPEAFISEVLNGKSGGLSAGIRIDKIPSEYWVWEGEPVIGRFIVVDLSTDKATPDKQTVGVFDLIPENSAVCKFMVEKKLAHDDLAEFIVSLALEWQVPCIFFEDVNFQHIMKREIEKVIESLGILNMTVNPLTPEGSSKAFRIINYCFKALLKKLEGFSAIRLDPQVRSMITTQIEQYTLGSKTNVDDMLDNLAYAHMVTKDPAKTSLTTLPISEILHEEMEEEMWEHGNTAF